MACGELHLFATKPYARTTLFDSTKESLTELIVKRLTGAMLEGKRVDVFGKDANGLISDRYSEEVISETGVEPASEILRDSTFQMQDCEEQLQDSLVSDGEATVHGDTVNGDRDMFG